MPSSDPRTFIHVLDATNRIVAVNAAWLEFAQENDAPHLTRAAVLQQSLWDFVTGVETQAIYEAILSRVRSAQISMRFAFRCDSPDRRRFMEMEVSPLSGQSIRLSCRVLRIELRPAIDWPAAAARRGQRFVTVCSWCKRLQLPTAEWVELEEATALLETEPGEMAPALSHGICDSCEGDWLKRFES